MKVILLQELKGKGGEGDVVEVAKGFFNNYLSPQKIAIEASTGNLKQLEQRKHNIAKREEDRIAKAHSVRNELVDKLVKIEAKVGEEGQLFGSVTTLMIAEAVQEATGLEIDRKRIDLKAPIKTAGEHEISISLYRDIKATLKLFVGGEEDLVSTEEVLEEAAGELEEAVDDAAEEAETAEVAEAGVIEEAEAAEDASASEGSAAPEGTL